MFLDIICSSKLRVFRELRSRKTVHFSEQIMSEEKYPSIFSRQMEAIVCVWSSTGWLYRVRQFQNWPRGNEIRVKPAVTMAPGYCDLVHVFCFGR